MSRPNRVTTSSGKAYYCYACWKKFAAPPPSEPDRNKKAETGQPPSPERRDD